MKPTEPPSSHLLNLWATWLWASCISQGFIQDDVYKNLLVICFALVLMCQDPGNVAHSHRILTGSRFTVGSTVQFICNKGYILSGNSLLTCYNRNSATPKWSESLPKCVRKSYKSSSEFNCCTHCKIIPLNIEFCQAQVCDSISDAFSWEVWAVQKPWCGLHQYAELWKGLLPSRRNADLLLSPWLRAAGWGHHLLYPWAPFTVE